MWHLFVVQLNLKIDEHGKLARVHNERNKEAYHFECIIYESFQGLRVEYHALFVQVLKWSRTGIRGVNMKRKHFACRCDGGEHRIVTQ